MEKESLLRYLSGNKLFGDDFSLKQIEEWFESERDGYANLGAKEKSKYNYVYHGLNKELGFKYIHKRVINKALGIGSAYGEEFLPIINKIENITILEPSNAFKQNTKIAGVPCEYVMPDFSGDMSFKTCRFDLIICLGVLHHIPNVSYVLKECHRVIEKGGIMLLREPIVSMGDWTNKRKGLTKNERGIPYQLFKEIILNAGFKIKNEKFFDFPAFIKILNFFKINAFSSRFLTKMDTFICMLFKWNINYHPKNTFQKFRPASVYFVLEKE